MLEMTNQELVKYWLTLRPDIEGGVFFDDANNLLVLSQDGGVESLYSSSFFQQLHLCIIYLDDGHTRGTDLILPPNFRAAVTLGPKVTKDRLVQGMMLIFPSNVANVEPIIRKNFQVACGCES